MNNILESVDFRRYPFRGILAEVAHELDVTRQSVQKSAHRGNPEILRRIAAKMRERRRQVERLERAVGE